MYFRHINSTLIYYKTLDIFGVVNAIECIFNTISFTTKVNVIKDFSKKSLRYKKYNKTFILYLIVYLSGLHRMISWTVVAMQWNYVVQAKKQPKVLIF